ncbi:MAG: SAM-dependent methyltransferase, partial [Bacilli bacterium]|nr:SAM-dependent methyltransferase [Bacilli bacterium]
MIKLSKRLNAISKMVDNNSVIADIGCDHALLDIYLLQSKKIKKSIACDITEGALNQARKNVNTYKINGIDLRLADGLDRIYKKDNVNTIILSGLVDNKIINILMNNIDKLSDINSIIIQSNTNISKIRKALVSISYYIEDEVLIKENNI